MKKGKKMALGIAIILIAIVIFFTVWQWDNINAIYMGIVSSEEKIEEKIRKNNEKLAKQLEEDGLINPKVVEGLSKEDEEKIAKGEMSVDEAVEKLFEPEDAYEQNNTTVSDASNDVVKQEQEVEITASASDVQQESDTESDEKFEQKQSENNDATNNTEISPKNLIETAVKKMYVLKAEYVEKLAVIESSAKKVFYRGEQTRERKLEIANDLLPQFVEAEKICDGKVEAILRELTDGLSALEADTSIVHAIREQYKNEKQLQKSKYINKYL